VPDRSATGGVALGRSPEAAQDPPRRERGEEILAVEEGHADDLLSLLADLEEASL